MVGFFFSLNDTVLSSQLMRFTLKNLAVFFVPSIIGMRWKDLSSDE